jgi:BirA family biotin operon repressor/biotin-[acetyl-CoA-carboxylase] ligase
MSEPIDPERIRGYLRGWYAGEIVAVRETGSTNDLAAEAGRNGARDGWVVFAGRQTRGRGRRGRQWEDAGGDSLAFSTVIRPGLGIRGWPRLTTMAGVAVAEAVERVADCEAQIKWPNDIIVRGKKLAGILAETFSGENPFAVIGIGLNVGQSRFPESLADIAISLRQVSGTAPDRHWVAAAALDRLTYWRAKVEGGFGEIVALAQERSCLIGREVRLIGGGAEGGIAKGLDAEGGLIVLGKDGVERAITSGEVSVRGV